MGCEERIEVAFHQAIREYGIDAFVWEVICQSKNRDYALNVMESYFIKELNSHYVYGHGYNMSFGGDAPMMRRKHSPETKAKMSQARLGKKKTYRADGTHYYAFPTQPVAVA